MSFEHFEECAETEANLILERLQDASLNFTECVVCEFTLQHLISYLFVCILLLN